MGRLDGAVRALARLIRPPRSASPAAPPATTVDTPTPLAPQLTRKLAELTEQRRHAEAISEIARFLPVHADDLEFLVQARASATKAGSLSLQRDAIDRQLAGWPDPVVARHARRLEGRWNETASTWTPTISAPVTPITKPVPGRVLHVLKVSLPHRQSGYTVRTKYTLIGQQDADLDVVATTALDFPAGIGIADAPDAEDVDGVPHLRLQRTEIPSKQPWDLYLDDWATALAPVVAEQRPEVIHVHSGHRGYDTALVALAVGRALDVPVVYEVRGFFESLWTADLAWTERSEVFRRRYHTEARCMREAAAVVTLSESMRAEIVSRGVAPSRVHVVPNGVDTDTFVRRPRSPELTESWSLTGRFVFGYVSNLDHLREGHELLIEAATLLRDSGVPATALIVGDGARKAELQDLTRRLGADDVVVFTGRIPHADVLDYYAMYDVFVVPRVDERAARLVTPLKPFEAMAAEVPVVVSDLAALREIIGDGSRGRTFRTGDAGSLASVLTELYGDPALRRDLAAAARAWVTAERQWSTNGVRYREIYDQVRASPPSSR